MDLFPPNLITLGYTAATLSFTKPVVLSVAAEALKRFPKLETVELRNTQNCSDGDLWEFEIKHPHLSLVRKEYEEHTLCCYRVGGGDDCK